MKKKFTVVFAILSASLLASCKSSNPSIDITLTLNSGIGVFDDNTITREIVVKQGTKLNQIQIDIPFFNNDILDSENVQPMYWTSEDNEIIAEDYIINKDTEITANHFESLNSLKNACLGKLFDIFARSCVVFDYEKMLKLYNFFVSEYANINSQWKAISCIRPASACFSSFLKDAEDLINLYKQFFDDINYYEIVKEVETIF